jgi:hypothetical protein
MLDAIEVKSDMPSFMIDFVKEKEEGHKEVFGD